LNETGWKIRLLTGDEEAQVTYRGALSVLDTASDEMYVVLDIGGGSTEIAYGIGPELISGRSLDIGSVRFTERFFKDSNPDLSTVDEVRAEVRRNLETVNTLKKPFSVVGVAGTVSSIAAVSIGLDRYDANILNGYSLERSVIEKYISQFIGLSPKEIEAINPLFLKWRGDVILAGIIILSEFLNWCGADSLTVSTGGIRHGIIT
jgi:exopolyphosphatase/guanosine-5'-triphosphate,3'-diphosphate pyrophosphatase